MATNKNAIIRYQALNKCFRNPGRKYFIEDLIDSCNEALNDINPSSSGVKRRQIFDDIKFMRDSRGYSAPIESYQDGKRTYYRYEDLSFSINSQPLNEQEARKLKEGLLTLSRFNGLPQFEWMEEIITRLEQTFKLKSEKKVMSFEDNPFLSGREHLSSLFDAIVYQKALKISYLPFTFDVPIVSEIHPYHLKEYNNRWFLFGLDHSSGKIVNLALDRIQSFNETHSTYIRNECINFDEFFDDVIGVTVPTDKVAETVLLKFDAETWPYIKTKPLHGSQKIKSHTSGYTIIQIGVIPNYELESLILQYGERIEVLQPEWLRKKISDRLKDASGKYTMDHKEQ
jgi:predicted DNA-binding transcriptional regulator YafY